ncbi:MAG: hypothetical protein JWO60_2965 [Frankiales bacterium]|nr:hypothetical protein [Frankiales bacterium]
MPDLTADAPAPSSDGLPVLTVPDQAALEAWLEEHAETARGVWLRLAKKSSGIPSPTWPEVVESLLCFGWIDGQRASDVDPWYRQRVTPRRPTSLWSQVNRSTVGRLQEQGRMRPGGLREVERAQADGRWERAYAPPSTAEVPGDLRAALDAVPAAAAAFAGLSGTNRYAVLHRVTTAKRVATRERRIEEFVQMLAEGRTPYPQGGAAPDPAP